MSAKEPASVSPPDVRASDPAKREAAARAATERARVLALRDAEDTKALVAFREGDADAFAGLARRHERGIFNFCLRMLGSRSAAEDAAQEVFLKIVRAAGGWEPKAKVRTWMYAMARNHCIDELRKAKHRQTESLDRPLSIGESDGATMLDRTADADAIRPDRGADSSKLRGHLVEAIESLPEDLREVFMLREQAGLPFKEIASIVGIPENTAKSRMRYALEGLRGHLAKAGITRDQLQETR